MNRVTTLKRSPQQNAHIGCQVNGEPVQVSVAPAKTLLEMLREDLQLTGTKHGCELGECGACAVLVDGEPILSCLYLALEAEGCSVDTIEGMAGEGHLHPLQAAFADLGGAQCGYCTPGYFADLQGPAGSSSQSRQGPDPGSPVRQPVPLHGLPADLRSRGRSHTAS